MLSVKGIYKNGVIQLLEPVKIEEKTEVIITFLDEDLSDYEENEDQDGYEDF